MQENTIHNLMGGMDMTSDLRVVALNSSRFSQDVEYYEDELNSFSGISPMKSTKLAFDIGQITPQNQIIRGLWNSTGSHPYSFGVYSISGNYITSINLLGVNSFLLLKSGIENALTALGISSTVTQYLSTNFFTITFNNNLNYVIKEYDFTTNQFFPLFMVQEAYSYTADIESLQSIYINNAAFFLSKAVGNSYCEIGGAIQDVNGVWAYHIIGSSSGLNFPLTEVIDGRIELRSDDKYALYYTDNTNKPKVFYFPIDFYSNANSAIIYASNFPISTGNTEGIYNFNAIAEQTNLQLLNNLGTIQFAGQLDSGGKLQAGSKRYAVRFGVYGTNNTTPFSYLSGEIIVYSESSTTVNAGNIKGDITPKETTKVNILNIKNANPNVFGYAEVACVEYMGGSVSAFIIGKFVVTSDTFNITHTGNEIATTLLPITAIPNVTPVITKAKNLEIKKNRLNFAAIELGVDEDLVAISSAITCTWSSTPISSVGNIASTAALNIFSVTSNNLVNTIDAGAIVRLLGGSIVSPISPPTFWDPTTGLYTVTFTTAGVTHFSFNVFLAPQAETVANAFISKFLNVFYGTSNASDNVDCTVNIERIRASVNTVVFSQQIQVGGQPGGWLSPLYDFYDTSLAGDEYQIVVHSGSGHTIYAAIAGFTAVKSAASFTGYKDSILLGEYNNPANTSSIMGYADYENYCFFIRYNYASGYISNPYYITTSQCPISNLTDGNTTSTRTVNIHFPIFSNIDISSVRDRIVGFSICRGICNPTVMGYGIYMPARQFAPDGYYVGQLASLPNGESVNYGSEVPNGDSKRYFGAFVSSDFLSNDGINFSSNDKLLVFSQPTILGKQNNIQGGISTQNGSYVEYLGDNVGTVNTYTIQDGQYLKFTGILPDLTSYGKYLKNTALNLVNRLVLASNSLKATMFQNAYAITTNNPVQRASLDVAPYDYGVYGSLIYRAQTNQYDIDNVDIIDCGNQFVITPQSPNTIDNYGIFGGDVFTQKVFIRILSGSAFSTTQQAWSFISFYAQNRINEQMRHSNPVTAIPLFPADSPTLNEYLFTPNTTGSEVFAIDEAYKEVDNKINVARKYNEKNPVEKIFPARIVYTQQKPTGSIYDGYRDIAPLDYKDIESKNGQIVALCDIDNQMITIQAKAVTKLPYQSDVLLKSDSGAEIYIGNGGVYAQRETIVSTYGTNLKSATYAGFNRNGNSVLYWMPVFYKRLMRYNYDGIKTLSWDAKLRNFFLKNLTFITNEYDVLLGYDTKRDTLWITSRTQNKTIGEFNIATTYNTGDLVKISSTANVTSFEQFPDIYKSKQDSNTGVLPYVDGAAFWWEFIPHTDNRYYNEWTLLFNETLNVFTTTSSILPKRYFLYKDSQLIPRGIASYGRIYEVNTGTDILKWLDQDGVFKQGKFIIEPVINKNTEGTKAFLSIGLNTGENNSNNPIIVCTTSTQTTTIATTDFEQVNSMIFAAINADNVGDNLQGEYMVVSIQTQLDIKILDVTGKIYYRPRNPYKA